MNYLLYAIILVLAANISAQDSLDTHSETGDLIVLITGFEHSEGTARVGLSNSELWEIQDTAYRGYTGEIINDSVKITFGDIPFGEYGVKVHHDEDSNDEMNTNFLGIPSENYGFSNNASGTFGPPSWEDAKFLFNTDTQVHEINLEE